MNISEFNDFHHKSAVKNQMHNHLIQILYKIQNIKQENKQKKFQIKKILQKIKKAKTKKSFQRSNIKVLKNQIFSKQVILK